MPDEDFVVNLNSEFKCGIAVLRARIELLEQDLSQALHLLYGLLVIVAACPESEFKRQTLRTVKAKFFQMPQGWPVGRGLIELDAQSGHILESKGVPLSRWVYEPRGRWNG
jgi:hypothetical protein